MNNKHMEFVLNKYPKSLAVVKLIELNLNFGDNQLILSLSLN